MSAKGHSLKTLLISPLPPPTSGIGTWTVNILGAATPRVDVRVEVVDTAVRWRSVSNLTMPVRLCGGSAQAARDLIRTWRRIRSFGPDVVHVNTSGHLSCPKDLLVLKMARRCGAGRIIHYHFGRLPGIIASNGWEWKLVRQAIALSQSVLVLNEESQRAVTGALPRTRVLSMPNPVDINALDRFDISGFPWHTNGKPALLFLGMVLEKKGARDLVDACTRIADTDFTLVMLGPVSDAYKADLTALAAGRGLADRVRFLGETDYPTAMGYVKSAQAVALPSHSEGFPNAVLEGMACGKPIVATRVGAMPEMVSADSDSPCGICVDLGDKDGLRSAVRLLMSDAELRNTMGQRGWKKAREEYSSEAVFARLVGEWERAAAERRH